MQNSRPKCEIAWDPLKLNCVFSGTKHYVCCGCFKHRSNHANKRPRSRCQLLILKQRTWRSNLCRWRRDEELPSTTFSFFKICVNLPKLQCVKSFYFFLSDLVLIFCIIIFLFWILFLIDFILCLCQIKSSFFYV